MKKNPYIEPENFFSGYEKSIDELKNNPELLNFNKLCYHLFHVNSQGKDFIEMVKERYIMPSLAQKGSVTYNVDLIWVDGFKDAWRLIINAIASHEQYIKHGDK